jgi:hypothetical protein
MSPAGQNHLTGNHAQLVMPFPRHLQPCPPRSWLSCPLLEAPVCSEDHCCPQESYGNHLSSFCFSLQHSAPFSQRLFCCVDTVSTYYNSGFQKSRTLAPSAALDSRAWHSRHSVNSSYRAKECQPCNRCVNGTPWP